MYSLQFTTSIYTVQNNLITVIVAQKILSDCAALLPNRLLINSVMKLEKEILKIHIYIYAMSKPVFMLVA